MDTSLFRIDRNLLGESRMENLWSNRAGNYTTMNRVYMVSNFGHHSSGIWASNNSIENEASDCLQNPHIGRKSLGSIGEWLRDRNGPQETFDVLYGPIL